MRRSAALIALAMVLAAGVAPFLSSYPLTLLTQAVIVAILAMSLDLLLGYTGLASLGHAAYFGVAAYAVAILTTQYQAGFVTCLVVGIALAAGTAAVFGLGAFLAALGGVIGGAFLGVYPGADFEVLPYAFVVVIVGGLGSLPGAMVGSVLVGLLDNFGKAIFPELSYFTLFAPMALILALRPTGLFGRT